MADMMALKLESFTPGSRRSKSMAGWFRTVSELVAAEPMPLPGGRPTRAAAAASGSSWLRLSSKKMSAVAWGLRDQTAVPNIVMRVNEIISK